MFANKKLLTTMCPGDAYAHQATHTHSQPLFLRLCMILLLSLVGMGSAWAATTFTKTESNNKITLASSNLDTQESVECIIEGTKYFTATNSLKWSTSASQNGEVAFFTVTAESGYAIESVAVTQNSTSQATASEITSGYELNYLNKVHTFTNTSSPVSSVSFKLTADPSKQEKYGSITVVLVSTSAPTTVVTPTFSPSAGSYTTTQNVTLSTTTEGATIYYTIDGNVPTSSSTKYTSPIEVIKNQTIKVIAIKDGMTDSDVTEATYTVSGGSTANNLTLIENSKTITPSASIANKSLVEDGYLFGCGGNSFQANKGVLVKTKDLYVAVNVKAGATVTVTGFCNGSTNDRELQLFTTLGGDKIATSGKISQGQTGTVSTTVDEDKIIYIYTNGYDLYVKQIEVSFPVAKNTITFNANDGSDEMAAQEVNSGEATALNANTFTPANGFSFVGWNTAADGTGTEYTPGQSVTLTEDLTLYAQWLRFSPQGAQSAKQTLIKGGSSVTYNLILQGSKDLSRAEDQFEISVDNGNVSAIYNGIGVDSHGNKFVYLQITPLNVGTDVVRVRYKGDGGLLYTERTLSVDFTVKGTYNVSIYDPLVGGTVTTETDLSSPIIEGTNITFTAQANEWYQIDNWYNEAVSPAILLDGAANEITIPVSSDLKVKANFARYYKIATSATNGTVTLKAGDEVITSETKIKSGTALKAIANPATDYHFVKWQLDDVDKEGGEELIISKVQDFVGASTTKIVTLTAIFEEDIVVDPTKVGEDNTTAFNSVHSEIKELAAGMTRHIEFKNYSDKAENWNNWILNVGTTTEKAKTPDVMQLRADSYDVLDNANTGKADNFNWGTFKNDMDGATVAMDVTNSGKHIYVNAEITTSEGTKYNYSAISTDKLADATAYLCLTVEKAHLTDLSIGEPVQAYELSYILKEFCGSAIEDVEGNITIKNAQRLALRKGTYVPNGEQVTYEAATRDNDPRYVYYKWESAADKAATYPQTVASANLTPTVLFLDKPGVSTPENIVTLSHPASKETGFKMYFTLDNSDPKTSESRYEYAPNTVAIRKNNNKVRAVAYIDGVYSTIQGTNVDYEPVTVLEARGSKVAEHGTFTNSTCTTSIAIGNENKAQWGISPNSEIEKSKVAYRSGSSSTATIQLTSTSAYKIVLSGYAGGADPRTISSIYVDGTKLTEGTDFDIIRSTSNKSLRRDIADRIVITLKTGKEIAQNSDVTFNFSGTVCICYYEIYGTSKTEFCEMPEIIPESYNSTDNLWSYTLIPAAGTTMKYVVVDLSKGEPLAGYPKEATASVTISKSTEPNLKEGLMIRAWSVDPAGIKVASSKAFTTVESLLTPVIKYNVKNNTATYNNANSSWDPAEPKLVIYPATLTSAVTYTSDDTTIGNGENGTVNIVKGAGQGVCRITATVIVAEGNTEGLRPGTYNGILTLGIVDGYPNMLKKDQKPIVGESIAINDKSGEKVLTLTYGGWTHNPQNGNAWNYKDNDSRADDWPKAGTFDGTPIDGYEDQSQQNNDSRSELGKDGRIVWEDEGTYSKVHPFSLPCRGAYITLVPECNGILTIYLVQNGCINTNKDTHLATDLSGPRPYYWFDQSGNVVMPSSVTTKQKIKTGYDEKVFKDGGNGVSTWMNNPELKPLVETYWPKTVDDVNDPYETAVKYRNGHLVFEKAYVKYIVNLCAGNTYYFFSNASKMGYAGLNFKPQTSVDILNMDGSVKKTVTTESDLVSLNQSQTFERPSSTTAYNKIQLANRSFAANTWNTICLPFAVSEAQVREVFGEGTQLIIYDGMNGNTAKFKYHVYQDILPGQAYLIKPTNTIESGNAIFKNVTISNDVEVVNNGTDGNDGTFTFVGTFDPVTVKAYDHVVSGNGKIGYFAQDVQMPGYRAYLLNNTGNTQNAAKISAISIGNAFDDEETTTEIMQLLIDDGVVFAPANGVYNINGQKVGNSTEGLPKGLYIVNGKKIFVR